MVWLETAEVKVYFIFSLKKKKAPEGEVQLLFKVYGKHSVADPDAVFDVWVFGKIAPGVSCDAFYQIRANQLAQGLF